MFKKLRTKINESYTARDDNSNIFSGIIGAMLGAFISSIIWIAIFLLGYVSSIGGILIGLATNYGYKKLNGPRGINQILVVTVFIIAAILFAQYTCEIISWYQLLAQEGYQIGLSDIGSVVSSVNYELAVNIEYASMFLKSLRSGLFYGAIGIVYIN